MAEDEARLTVRHGNYSIGLANSLFEDLKGDSEKTEEHFVEFECEDGSRHIHRVVLMLNCLDVGDNMDTWLPVPTKTFDRVIEFIYENETTLIGYNQIMGAYEVAKQLHCADLVREIERGFECGLRKFLSRAKFVEMCSNDKYETLAEMIGNLRLDAETKTILLHRIAASSPAGSLQKDVLGCKTSPRIYCYYPRASFHEVVDAMTLESVECKIDVQHLNWCRAAVFEDKMFADELNSASLLILSFSSGELLQEIPISDLQGTTFYNGEPYAWTEKQMFLLRLDASSNKYKPELILSEGYFSNVRILRRTGKQIVFARQNAGDVEIVSVRKAEDEYNYKVVKKEPDCDLIGNVGDAVWVWSGNSGQYTNLQTCESILFKRKYVISRKILNGYIFSLTREGGLTLIWGTDLETRRSTCSGLEGSSNNGCLIESF